jgi:hypothetical protein
MKCLLFIGLYIVLRCKTEMYNGDKMSKMTDQEFTQDTTITVEWLGQSCFCPNWIEISYLPEMRNDTLGVVKDNFSIALQASDPLNDLHNDPLIGKQTPLVFKLNGRFFKDPIEHTSKGQSFKARTFQYDAYQMLEY